MRKGIHPDNYRMVAFKDMSNDDVFLTKSTAETKETIEVDGVEYPLVKLEISRTSHPYYTGKVKLVDTAGRIDKFKNKYAKFKKPAANVGFSGRRINLAFTKISIFLPFKMKTKSLEILVSRLFSFIDLR